MCRHLNIRISKQKLLGIAIGLFFISFPMESCRMLNYNQPPEYSTDIVCGRRTDKSEAYEFRYGGSKYYFDSYNCKQIFKENPQKFIDNKCVELK